MSSAEALKRRIEELVDLLAAAREERDDAQAAANEWRETAQRIASGRDLLKPGLCLVPESRCSQYGHVLTDHNALGPACARCGQFDPTWQLRDDGAYWPTRSTDA